MLRRAGDGWILRLRDEPDYAFDPDEHDVERRLALLERDGVQRALLAISSPLGIEGLSRPDAEPLLEAHNEGLLELGGPFGVWGAVSLRPPDPADVDALLAAGAVGISLPAGALSGPDGFRRCGRARSSASSGATRRCSSTPGRTRGARGARRPTPITACLRGGRR